MGFRNQTLPASEGRRWQAACPFAATLGHCLRTDPRVAPLSRPRVRARWPSSQHSSSTCLCKQSCTGAQPPHLFSHCHSLPAASGAEGSGESNSLQSPKHLLSGSSHISQTLLWGNIPEFAFARDYRAWGTRRFTVASSQNSLFCIIIN